MPGVRLTRIAAAAAGLLFALSATAVPAHAVTDLLPALVPVRADLEDHELVKSRGKVKLRFTGTIANHGEGVLHIIGKRDEAASGRANTMTAWQRLSRSDGSTREVRIGKMVYEQGHDHFHLKDATRYRLLAPDGTIVKEAAKVTFCMWDTEPSRKDLPGFSSSRVFPFCAPDPTASRIEMGISVGWADVYGKDLPGQSFDVTSLMDEPARDYTLQMTVNPHGVLREANQDKPVTASVTVRIGKGVSVRSR